jgi:uncharacterized protein (DUF1499 family)
MPTPKKWGFSIAAASVLVGAAWVYWNRRLFLVNDVTTGESFDYPDLRAHVYFASIDNVAKAAEQAIASLSKWRLVFNDIDKKVLVAEVEAPIGGFLSEVTITLSHLGPRHIRTVIRSSSKVGKGDLGENDRYIRQAQDAMDLILVGG